MSKRSFKMRRCELGRSMWEMLGVLAIIGILSIGGISMWQYSMTAYKANCTNEDVITRAVAVPAQDERFYLRNQDHEFFFAVLPGKGTEGRYYPMHTKGSDKTGYTYRVVVGEDEKQVEEKVCKRILETQTSKEVSAIFVNDVEYEGDNTICLETGNQMVFYFNGLTGTGDSSVIVDNGGNNTSGNEQQDCDNKIMCYTGDCCNQYMAVCPQDGECPPCTPKEACDGCTPTVCQMGDCCDKELTACFYEGEECEACVPTSECHFCIYKFAWPSEPYAISHNDNGVSWIETKEVGYQQIVGCSEEGTYCAVRWKDKNCAMLDENPYNGYGYGVCVESSVDASSATCPSVGN